MHVDIVFAADPRFPGGTSTSTANEIAAAVRAGLTVGLLPFRGPTLKAPRFFHPDLRARLDAGDAALITAETDATTDLVLVEHATLFTHMPARPVALTTRAAALVANHPPRFTTTAAEYDPAAVVTAIGRYFNAPAFAIPISPITRTLLGESGLDSARILPEDWPRVIDPDAWAMPIRPPSPDRALVVGRHARPSPAKWPDSAEEILAAYPAEGCRVILLGGGPPTDRLAVLPPSWSIMPFDPGRPRAFLAAIDVYVHFHSRRYLESFGMGPLEAMAAGKVVILPALYRPLFGEAALYARPDEVAGLLSALKADPERYRIQAERARGIARERFGFPAWRAGHDVCRRFAGLPAVPDPPAAVARPAVEPPQRRVLFVSSNGTGLGHLTRLMAIAERLPAGFRASFFTLSQAAAVVRQRGFPVDFVPSHQGRGLADGVWNRAFAHEVALALHHFRPDAVVFDGSAPYQGLLEVLAERPDLASIWVRRGLWRPGQNEAMPARAAQFDAVIEPGELAGSEDVGATAALRGRVIAVDPIVLVDPADRLDRAAARAALDLDPAAVLVLLQLGSGVDYDLTDLRFALIEGLVARGATVVEVVSPLATKGADEAADGVIRRQVYPLARVAAAFDLIVTEAGYNSFHEIVLSGLPAVLIPRDGGGMDDQFLRARYAESIGLALTLRGRDVDRVEGVLDLALSPAFAAAVRQRAAGLAIGNGAAAAARFIAESALSVRADRPLAYAIAR